MRKYREELAALGHAPVAAEENADEVAPVGPAPLRCDWIGADGAQCGYTAQSTTALLPHTDIAFMVCASLHDKLWFAISARGVVGSLLPLRLPNVMLMPVSKKGTALDKGGMLLAWWSNCVPLQLFDVQSSLSS